MNIKTVLGAIIVAAAFISVQAQTGATPAQSAQDIVLGDFKPAVEIDGRDDGLIHRRRQRAGHLLARADALADDQQLGQSGFDCNFRARAT